MEFEVRKVCVSSITNSKELCYDNQKFIKTLLSINILTRH